MKKRIVEKKFLSYRPSIASEPRQFRQVTTPMRALEEVSSIYENIEQHHTIYSQFKEKSQSFHNFQNSIQFYKKENAFELLSYSQTEIQPFEDELLPLISKFVKLFTSRQHITNHIANSLGFKGYRGDTARELAKTITNSFGQYITLAETILDKLKEQKDRHFDESTIKLNRMVASLKKQNALQFQQIARLEEINHRFKKKFYQLVDQKNAPVQKQVPKSLLQEAKQKIKCQKTSLSAQMDKMESQIYQRLATYQETLLKLSAFRNHIMLDKNNIRLPQMPENHSIGSQTDVEYPTMTENQKESQDCRQELIDAYNQIIEGKEAQINRLSHLIYQTTEQLELQKKLYDQMLEKNIALQKEVYFLNAQRDSVQQTSSFHINQQSGSTPRNLRSPSFQDSFQQ